MPGGTASCLPASWASSLTCCRSASSIWRLPGSKRQKSTVCSVTSSTLSSIQPTMLLRLREHQSPKPAIYGSLAPTGSSVAMHGRRPMCGASWPPRPATMMITDPPYNLPIKRVQGRGHIKHGNFAQASGEMSPAEFTEFLRTVLSLAAEHSISGSIHFVFMDWRHLGQLLAAGSVVYSELKNLIVWAKTTPGQGSFYRSGHELILAFKNGDGQHVNNVELGRRGRNRSNVWTYAELNTFWTGRIDDLAMHPTMKPVALVSDAIRDCSRRGDIVLDLFMGSGTTIVAADRVGRRARGLEIDPSFVDVAVRRWQAFTKRDAVLRDTGQSFEEVSAARSKTGAPRDEQS